MRLVGFRLRLVGLWFRRWFWHIEADGAGLNDYALCEVVWIGFPGGINHVGAWSGNIVEVADRDLFLGGVSRFDLTQILPKAALGGSPSLFKVSHLIVRLNGVAIPENKQVVHTQK